MTNHESGRIRKFKIFKLFHQLGSFTVIGDDPTWKNSIETKLVGDIGDQQSKKHWNQPERIICKHKAESGEGVCEKSSHWTFLKWGANTWSDKNLHQ